MKKIYGKMILISGFVSYFIYLTESSKEEEVIPEEMKELLSRNMLMGLELNSRLYEHLKKQ